MNMPLNHENNCHPNFNYPHNVSNRYYLYQLPQLFLQQLCRVTHRMPISWCPICTVRKPSEWLHFLCWYSFVCFATLYQSLSTMTETSILYFCVKNTYTNPNTIGFDWWWLSWWSWLWRRWTISLLCMRTVVLHLLWQDPAHAWRYILIKTVIVTRE